MKTKHLIVNGDSRQMNKIRNNSVHLIVTSPPYWQLKDYGTENQIGFNDSYEDYINNLNIVWKESFRILHDGCRLCINIGDQFARSVYYGRYKVIPIRTEIIKFCEAIGFDYMGAVIWQKATTMNTSGGGAIMGSFPYPRNGILKLDYEFILIFKKQGLAPKPSLEQKKSSEMTKEEWNTYFSGHWSFGGARQEGGHIAMYPEELPSRLIKMFSFVGETIFDPFLGSGTTSLAAKNLNRNSIGYEINPDFIPIIKNKLNVGQSDILGTEYVFEEDNSILDTSGLDMPYVFKDPLKLDKKIDVKTLQFGSRLDSEGSKTEDYFTIKEILSSNMVKLDSGAIVRLIGIKDDPIGVRAVSEFIIKKTKGQKIFLKFDAIKHDENNVLMAYIYLKNKTFLNAHILKAGLADIDTSFDFKYKNKFQQLILLKNG